MQKILIVEDEWSILKALGEKFTREGFQVLKAIDGKQGLEIALRDHPDMILLDVIMPNVDGLAMLKALREDAWGKNAPVIILTNLNDTEKLNASVQTSGYEYLVKSDWKIADVVAKVKAKLGSNKTAPPETSV